MNPILLLPTAAAPAAGIGYDVSVGTDPTNRTSPCPELALAPGLRGHDD